MLQPHMKILTVFGTRPEAIKLAILVKMLESTAGIESRVCVTAQHRQMLDSVLDLFKIRPHYDLNVMKPKQTLGEITIAVLGGISEILREFRPDRILVHGDTTTTFAATLAAYYEKIPVGHIEAGLRTGDIYSPYPEEINRRLTDQISDLLFAPTEAAAQNLKNEGVSAQRIVVTGNTVIDTLDYAISVIESNSETGRLLSAQFSFLDSSKKLILVTGHRRENFGEGMEQVCESIHALAQREDVQVVYPVHLNPNVQDPVNRILGKQKNVHLLRPLDYLPFVYLMNRSYFIMTDSGGVQEEAPSLGKPILITREVTERPEVISSGAAIIVGTKKNKIMTESNRLLDDPTHYVEMGHRRDLYGDGNASSRIVAKLQEFSSRGNRI